MLPDRHGRYGRYGGRFVPETLMPALLELEEAYRRISRDPEFRRELSWYLKDYVGRPTPLYFARHLTAALGGVRRSTSSGKTWPTPGPTRSTTPWGRGCWPGAWAKPGSSPRPGPGQHGVATATVAALLGLSCDIYMGTEDIRRQRLNVIRMVCWGPRWCRWSPAAAP